MRSRILFYQHNIERFLGVQVLNVERLHKRPSLLYVMLVVLTKKSADKGLGGNKQTPMFAELAWKKK